jgi:hypothetical protein
MASAPTSSGPSTAALGSEDIGDYSGFTRLPQRDIGGAELPPMDPRVGFAEIERRRTVAAATGGGAGASSLPTMDGEVPAGAGGDEDPTDPAATLTVDPGAAAAMAQRHAFNAQYGGVWVINCANKDFSTQCRVPNIRLLRYFPGNPDLRANFPGDKDAGDAAVHASAHAAADEFIHTIMRDPRIKAVPIKATANAPFLIPASEAAACCPQHVHGKIARAVARHSETLRFRDEEMQHRVETKSSGVTGVSTYTRHKRYLASGKGDGVLPPRAALPAEDEARLTARVAAASAAAAAASAEEVAPPPVVQGPLPDHWTGAGAGSGAAAAPSALPVVEEWPADLATRSGNHAIISFLFDDDTPEDDPEFASAAGREPLVVIFGGVHKDPEAAEAFKQAHLRLWCKDITLDTVDTYEWLWPTEIDPDAVPTSHQGGSDAATREQNAVFGARTRELANVSAAREAMGDALPSRNVNALPNLEDAAATYAPPMRVVGTSGPAAPPAEDAAPAPRVLADF